MKKIFKYITCETSFPLLGTLVWLFNVIFLVTLFFSCNNRKSTQCELTDSIVVAYYPYIFETSTNVKCKDMMSWAVRISPIDTIKLPRDYFYILKDSLKNPQIYEKKPIDCRILIKSDGYNFGIDQFLNVVNENEKNVKLSPKFIYTILKEIKYFNYFSMEDLEYSFIIEHFGIPDDYKYISLKDSIKVFKEEGGFEYIRKPKELRKIYIVPSN